ncbi:MAG: SDR family NAD(P)-dependent oxidoreductase [Leptospiraceae bacterium]|nr:SDR family NAD(P)-dependent oxidoreductase [Leptospiraceae bacterium]
MSELKNKLILLTGATGGLGKEMTKSFLKEGARIVISDLNKNTLEELKESLENIGPGKIEGIIESDLSTKEGCESLVNEFYKFKDAPDILVNNAGIAVIGPFVSQPTEKWEKVLDINLYAPMRITHKFLDAMIQKKSGHIVNISSVAGLISVPGMNSYSVSKFGIKTFGEALQGEVNQFGIKVTNCYPFFTRTPILDSEQIGVKNEMKVPDFLLSEPDDVIHELVNGIKSNKLHVYPGNISKMVEFSNRLLPGIISAFTGMFVTGENSIFPSNKN